jgi:flagellar M-ring protein FliF
MAAFDVDRIRAQGKRFIEGFTPGQKAVTILVTVMVILGGMYFMKWASAPTWTPLYSGLSSQDAGAVTAQLDAQGIKYKIGGGGSTILVNQPDVYKTRISLSAKGIPSGGNSFDLLDKSGITTDQFTRNIDYQRALQDELSKTIQSIDSVAGASVTLTIPNDNVFVGAQQDNATAAVLVKPANGALDDSTVQAIVHLVASSIPNMKPEDVTVADSNGNVLHAPGVDPSLTGTGAISQQTDYENAVEQRISDMISKTLGPGHAAVTVAADLDMSNHNTTTNTVTQPVPGKDVPSQSNDTSEQLTQPGGTVPSGIVGVGNNGSATSATGGSTSYKKTTTQHTNALDTTSDTSTTPPGTVKRLSVSVLFDSAVVNPADAVNIWKPQIQAAAGTVQSRDTVTVQSVAFTKDALKNNKPAAPPAASGNAMFDLIKHVLTFLMIGLILFFAWRAIKKAESNRVPIRVPIDLRELEATTPAALEAPARTGASISSGGGLRALEPVPSTIEGEITDLIERQPDEVAQTLRSWLADRRT